MISGKVWNSFWRIAYESKYPYAIVEDGWVITMHPHRGAGVFAPDVVSGGGWIHLDNLGAMNYPLHHGATLTRLTVDGWNVSYALDDGKLVAAPYTNPPAGIKPLHARDVWRLIENTRCIGQIKKYAPGRFTASERFVLTGNGLVEADVTTDVTYSGEYLRESQVLRGKDVDMALTARDVLVLRATEGTAFFVVAPIVAPVLLRRLLDTTI